MIAELVIALIATLLIHEAGHAIAAVALRLPCRPVVTRYGPGILIGSDDLKLSSWQMRVTAVSGPAANLATVALCFQFHFGLLPLFSVVFAVVNLIPMARSDGHRILHPTR